MHTLTNRFHLPLAMLAMLIASGCPTTAPDDDDSAGDDDDATGDDDDATGDDDDATGDDDDATGDDDDDATGDDDDATGDDDDATGDDDDATGDDDDATGDDDDACGGFTASFSGSLCGGDGAPCALLENVLLPSAPASRNGAPSITRAADGTLHVLYSEAMGGFHGFVASAGSSGWAEADFPSPVALGGLTATADGEIWSLTHDGTMSDAGLYQREEDGSWITAAPATGTYLARAGAFEADDAGCLHASLNDLDDSSRLYARYDGSWTTWEAGDPDEGSSYRGPLALAEGGQPHMTWWAADPTGGGWSIFWAAPPAAGELARTSGSSFLEGAQLTIGTTPPTDEAPLGVPHILADPNRRGGNQELIYLRRSGATWEEFSVAEADPAAARSCGEPFEGATCTLDYLSYVPLAVASSSAGDVRFLYAEHHHQGALVAECMMGGPGGGFCSWLGEIAITGSLVVAWEDAGTINRSELATGFAATAADLEQDETGDLHLVVYATTDAKTGPADLPEVRYLRIGTAP